MHYAFGYEDNKRMLQLLSQFGFSENVFDKGELRIFLAIKQTLLNNDVEDNQ